jgi:hypothetical protein
MVPLLCSGHLAAMGFLLIYTLEFFILTYMRLKALGCSEDDALESPRA